MDNPVKYIARFKVETRTPLAIGSGRGGLLNERLIIKDANSLPYMPGTALAGIVRHELEKDPTFKAEVALLFGYQKPGEKEGRGSRIVFSPGLMLAKDGSSVLEGLQEINFECDYYKPFKSLPQRDHVRINHRGVAAKTGKYEDQLVYTGTRFVFELELEGTEADQEIWDKILNILNHPSFRIGAGTRKGFGALKVLECRTKIFHLKTRKEDFAAYLQRSSSLNEPIGGWCKHEEQEDSKVGAWTHYKITVSPDSHFFIFGSGMSSKEANLTPKREKCWQWEPGKEPRLEALTLIPATSIKGAIAHRLAYHYNLSQGTSIEKLLKTMALPAFDTEQAVQALIRQQLPADIEQLDFAPESSAWGELERKLQSLTIDQSPLWQAYQDQAAQYADYDDHPLLPVGENNPAVAAIFGSAKKENGGAWGKAIFSDIYLSGVYATHFFNHVSIDRFTGGARAGALFTQEVSASGQWPAMDIFIASEALKDPAIKAAFEKTLTDLCNGLLPVGGSTAKGHGALKGDWQIVQNS